MADEKNPAPGAGDVAITLDGKIHIMRPTLQACIALSRVAGGIAQAVRRCEQLDFDMICEVVSQGLAVNPVQREKFIEPAVYRAGTINICGEVIMFLRVVANGGRLPDDDEDGQGGEGGEADDPLANQSQSENSTAG